MRALKTWQERVRAARETAQGEIGFALPALTAGYLYALTVMLDFRLAQLVGVLIAAAITIPLLLLWYRFRGTTRPLIRLPIIVESALIVALFIGGHVLFDPPIWLTLTFAVCLSAWTAVHALTIPRSWSGPHSPPGDGALPAAKHVARATAQR